MSTSPETALAALQAMGSIVDAELSSLLSAQANGTTARMYDMLRYFMGYLTEDFSQESAGSGKRFRPALSLILADAYGARPQALEAALALELFHNFTLIHDDVEDRDEYRRNKPTVWKLWGINHAINSGDAQALLASKWALRAARHPTVGPELATMLLDAFSEVIEGQYLDFELADAPIDSPAVCEEGYLRMIEKKSGVLVRAAAETAGLAAGKEDERALLCEFGLYLGTAYQIADDYRSIWATQIETGKDSYSDIREHKRTLPFLCAYAESVGAPHDRLKILYSLQRQLSSDEIVEAREIINGTDAQVKVSALIRSHAERAKGAAAGLSLPDAARALLMGIVDALVPEGSKRP